jgi:hypothetical protein
VKPGRRVEKQGVLWIGMKKLHANAGKIVRAAFLSGTTNTEWSICTIKKAST